MFAGVIRQASLCLVLVVAVSLPLSVRAESAPADDAPLTMAEASAAALSHALEVTPSVIWPDAPAPASVAPYVSAAREQVWGNAIERLLWPLHLRFVEARCSRDSAVALIYQEIRPLLPLRTYAYAARSSMPTSTEDAWGGGSGIWSVLDDPEFVRLRGPDSGACP
jgi:hypothetical protein